MKFRVIIMPRAEADIEVNARWWAAHHSVQQSVLWFDAVHEQLKSLSALPESYGLSAEGDRFPYEIRDKPIGLGSHRAYRAVFTIRENSVYVLAVRRAAQDVVRPNEVDTPRLP